MEAAPPSLPLDINLQPEATHYRGRTTDYNLLPASIRYVVELAFVEKIKYLYVTSKEKYCGNQGDPTQIYTAVAIFSDCSHTSYEVRRDTIEKIPRALLDDYWKHGVGKDDTKYLRELEDERRIEENIRKEKERRAAHQKEKEKREKEEQEKKEKEQNKSNEKTEEKRSVTIRQDHPHIPPGTRESSVQYVSESPVKQDTLDKVNRSKRGR